METKLSLLLQKVREARIATFEIPTVIDVIPNENRLGGSMGPQIHRLLLSMHANISIVLASATNQLGHDTGNGTYNGILGLLQQDLADIMFFSYGMPVGSDIIDYSAVTNSVRGGLYSFPKPATKDTKVATTAYHVYSPSGWTVIFALIALFSLFLHFYVKWTKRPTIGYWILTSTATFLNQANIRNVTGAVRWVVVSFLLSAGILLEIFEQAINMDLVAKDYSTFINSLDDLLDLNYIPSFFKDDVFTNVFAKSNIKKFQRVWNRERVLCKFDPRTIPASVPYDKIFLGNEHIGVGLSCIYCKRDPKAKLWIAPEFFADIPFAYYLRKNLPAEVMSFYTKSPVMHGMIEYGLHDAVWTQGSIRGISSIGASFSCGTSKMDDIFPKSEHKGLSMSAVFDLFLFYLILDAISVLVLLFTIVMSKLRH